MTPPTSRLYYTDSYATEFDAEVLRVEDHHGRPAAVLDRTAFYPTSGGQPSDTGRLNEAAVLDVIDGAEGVILHVLDRALGTGPARGRIDWPRRFEHMQQHTGQHLLSAAFDRLHHVRTDSFHLGFESCTIDLARAVSAREIEEAEDEACRVVWADRLVTIRFADAAEASALPLRKEPARSGPLRLIEVEDFDISACGGTHVARTGAVGTIAVASTERFRAGSRIEFVCGVRALRSFRMLRDAVTSSVRLLSVLPPDLPSAIEHLRTDAKETSRRLKAAHARLAGFEAIALAARAEAYGDVRVVIEALEGWDPPGLKTIASAVVQHRGHIAVLFGVPAPATVIVARSADTVFDSAAALQRLTERFGGKGGGRPDLAQGGGLQGTPEALCAFARTLF